MKNTVIIVFFCLQALCLATIIFVQIKYRIEKFFLDQTL